MSKKYQPINLVKRKRGYFLQIYLDNYGELAEFQKGLLSGLLAMRDLEEIKNGEFIYWIARILKDSICFKDYELWDRLNKEKKEKSDE